MHKNEFSKTNGVQEEEEDGTNAEIVSILLSAGLTSPPPSPQPISPPPLQVRRTFSPYAGPSRGNQMPSSTFGGNMDRPCASVPSLKELPDYCRPNSTDPASVRPPPAYRHTPTPPTFLQKSPSLPKIGMHGSIASSMVLAGATLGRGASHDSLCQLATVLREANDAIIGGDVSGQGIKRHPTQTSEQERDDKEEGLGKEERQPSPGEDGAHQPLSPSPTLPTHHGPPTDPTASCPTDSISPCHHPPTLLPPSLPARLRPLPLGLGQLRLLCFGGYAFLLLAMYGISPFFQEDAQSRLGLPSSLVGLTFSLSALTSMLITPLAAHLCQAFGRYRTLFLGYVLALLANVGFALSRTSPSLLSFRSAQGLAMGLVAVASMTLLIAGAPDIVKEMGLQELVISVTLIIAPILGGGFYEVMSVERTYLALSAPLLGMVVVLGGMLWSVRRMEGRKEEGRKRCADGGGLKMVVMDREEGNGGVRMWVLDQGGEEGKEEGWQGGKQTAPVSFASIPSLVEREEEGREEQGEEEMGVEWGEGEGRGGWIGKREEGRERESWGLDGGDGLRKRWEVAHGGGDGKGGTSVRDAERPGRNNTQVWRHPRVLLIAVAITLTFASQGFLALSFGVHSRNLLGLASGAVGLFYSAFSLPYALMGVVIGPLARRVASSTLITYGTLLEALGLLLLGPPPALLPLSSPPSSPPSPPLPPSCGPSPSWGMLCLGGRDGPHHNARHRRHA
ncbi:sugar transporter, partial [Nannochloropsis gaditana]